jgi:hypothetical protein
MQTLTDKTTVQDTTAQGTITQAEVIVSPPSVDIQTGSSIVPPPVPARKPKNSPVKKVEKAKPAIERNDIKVPQVFPPKIRRDEKWAQKGGIKPPESETAKLTEEEQYAYDQLMLALSITSSKLKIVKDKVGGTDE